MRAAGLARGFGVEMVPDCVVWLPGFVVVDSGIEVELGEDDAILSNVYVYEINWLVSSDLSSTAV